MNRKRIGGDPHWLTARFQSDCRRCGKSIRKGERAFYYPNGRVIDCDDDPCGQQDQPEAPEEIMTFREYWYSLSPDQKQNLVLKTDLAYSTLWSIADGRRNVGLDVAYKLRKDKRITRDMLKQLNPKL